MKKRSALFLSLLLTVISGGGISSAGAAIFGTGKTLEVFVAADAIASPEGFRPKPGKPIYYLLFQTRETLGEAIGGVKLPGPAAVEKAVMAELEKQGFIRAQEGGPPADIVIFAVLGDANFKIEFTPKGNPYMDDDFRPYMDRVNVRSVVMGLGLWGKVQESLVDLFPPENPFIFPHPDPRIAEAQEAIVNEALRIRNREPARRRNAIKALVAANKVEQAVSNRSLSGLEAEKIAMLIFDNQYYLSLSAVEAKKNPDGGRRFLWRTSMLIDWREDFSQALPAMLAQAGPVFGTDVAVPGFVNTAKPRQGNVEIGETKVVPSKASSDAVKK